MTVSELQQAKATGCPVILKANPPRTYCDAKYRRCWQSLCGKLSADYNP